MKLRFTILIFYFLFFIFNSFSQTLVKDIAPGLASSKVHKIWPFNNGFVFGADDGFNGTELFYSDGTANGTVMLTNLYNSIYPSYFSFSGNAFTEIDNFGYFFANTASNKLSFFRTDGTVTGTEILVDSIVNYWSGLTRIFKMSNKVCFLISDKFYQYNPTTHSTSIVSINAPSFKPFQNKTNITDLYSGINWDNIQLYTEEQYIIEPYVYNNKLYGTSGDSVIYSLNINGVLSQVEVFPELMNMMQNGLNIGPIINNKFLFQTQEVNNIPNYPDTENELYYFDFATETGGLLKDVNPYFDYGSVPYFAYLPYFNSQQHHYLYFAATTENYGREIWVTDGTTSGTHLVEDYYPGPVSGMELSIYGQINTSIYYGDTLILQEHKTWTDSSIFYLTADVNGVHEHNFVADPLYNNHFNLGNIDYPISNVEDFNSFDDMYYQESNFINFVQPYDTTALFFRFSDFNNLRGYLTPLSCVNSNTVPYRTSFFKIGCNLYFIFNDCDFTGRELFKYDLCSFVSGIPETEPSNTVSIYPNPTNGSITIESQNTKGIYQLYDVTGKLLLSGNVNAKKFSLDISVFSKGIYFLTLQTNEGLTTKKIEIVK